MAPIEQQLSAASVLKFLQTARGRSGARSRSDARDAGSERRRSAYRQAAAVLAAIRSAASLNPVGMSGRPGEAENLLEDELIPVTSRSLDGKFMLAPQARRAALRELGSRERMIEALEVNPQERSGAVQAQLEQYIYGTARPPDQQPLAELECSLQALLWLDDALDGLPSIDEVSAQLELRRMLAPFEVLAGDAVFRGRRAEMDSLRMYVGIIPPQALLDRLLDRAFRWTRPDMQPALSLYGPGGVGKSALVARFMLEHTRVPEAGKLPFAYLDFDRPGFDIGDPLALCVEMVRQLQLQFSAQAPFGSLHRFVADQVQAGRRSRKPDDDMPDQSAQVRSVLADVLGSMEKALGPRPYIVVLDSFEEVQYRGEARAFPFWEVLKMLQERWPFLRVVVSGRAPATTLRLAGKPPIQLELGALDREAAIAFLQAQGVPDEPLAQRLVDSFGGIPLTLKLLASLSQREASGDINVKSNASFWFSASDSVIQGQLYERILGHIHNPRVQRLAFPGLVLRRVTPDVIRHVLDEPCDLAIRDDADAEQLFEELRRETALVTFDDADGSLVHRADLRRVMLTLLMQKAPAQVEKIRRSAIAWYSDQKGRRARAEAVYHQLHLGQEVDPKAFFDPEVKSSIQASIADFPEETQREIASFGLQTSSTIFAGATTHQFDAYHAARIEELLPHGQQSVAEARQLLVESGVLRRNELRLDRASALHRAAARIAAQEERSDHALRYIEQGLAHSVRAGATDITLGLLVEQSWLLRDDMRALPASLSLLGEYARRCQSRTATIQHRIQSLNDPKNPSRDDLVSWIELGRLFLELEPLELWGLVPAVSMVLPRLLDGDDRGRLSEHVRSLLLDDPSPFPVALFADRTAQKALGYLLDQGLDGRNYQDRLAHGFGRLARAWPYRVLHVHPPYGTTRERLTESIA